MLLIIYVLWWCRARSYFRNRNLGARSKETTSKHGNVEFLSSSEKTSHLNCLINPFSWSNSVAKGTNRYADNSIYTILDMLILPPLFIHFFFCFDLLKARCHHWPIPSQLMMYTRHFTRLLTGRSSPMKNGRNSQKNQRINQLLSWHLLPNLLSGSLRMLLELNFFAKMV